MIQNTRTALITGASSGIGAEFARQLARRGWSLVLVARRLERLEQLAAELEKQHGVAVQAWQADLTQPDEIVRVAQRLSAMPQIAMLINNAGFDTNTPFAKSDILRELDMVRLHVDATMQLSRAALPSMLAARYGAIINVSSLGALVPTPGHAAYCASKAALITFSETLQLELHGTGVRVQALCPGLTCSEFHDTAAFADFDRSYFPEHFWMSAAEVVSTSLHCLECGRVVCVPGRANRMLATCSRIGLAPLLWRALAAMPRRRS